MQPKSKAIIKDKCGNGNFTCILLKHFNFMFGWLAQRLNGPFSYFKAREQCLDTPCVFCRYLKKQRSAPLFLAQPVHIHLFCICCENFRRLSLKVRSPGHVKWPHLRRIVNARHNYTNWTVTLKLSAIDTSRSIAKMYIYLGILITVRPILRPLHCQWDTN